MAPIRLPKLVAGSSAVVPDADDESKAVAEAATATAAPAATAAAAAAAKPAPETAPATAAPAAAEAAAAAMPAPETAPAAPAPAACAAAKPAPETAPSQERVHFQEILETPALRGSIDGLSRDERVMRAALYLYDAVTGQPPCHREDVMGRRLHYFLNSFAVHRVILPAIALCHFLLAVFEPPALVGAAALPASVLGGARRAPGQPLWVSCADAFCIAILLAHAVLRLKTIREADIGQDAGRGLRGRLSLTQRSRDPDALTDRVAPSRCVRVRALASRAPWELAMFVAALVLIVEFAVASTGALGYQQRFSVVRPCRALRLVPLLDLHPPLKVMIGHIWLSVFNLRDVVLMSLAFLIAFVLAAMLLFPAGTPEGDVVFRSFYVTFMELVYLFVGAVNFPDIMLPATIEMSRWYVLFFALFFVVMVMIVGNLMLAEIWNRYADILEADAVARIRNRRQAVGDAWLYLDVDNDSTLDRNEFMDAVLTVRRVRRTAWGLSPWMSVSELEWMSSALRHQDDQLCDPMVFVLWSIVDKDGNGEIDPSDFFSIVDVLLLSNSERAWRSGGGGGTGGELWIEPSPWDGRAAPAPREDAPDAAVTSTAAFWRARRERLSASFPRATAAEAAGRRVPAALAHGAVTLGCMALSFMYGGLLPQLRSVVRSRACRRASELAMAALIVSAVSTALASPREGSTGLAVCVALELGATAAFVLEALLRVLAVGLVGYVRSPLWFFEGTISCVACWALFYTRYIDDGLSAGGNGGASAVLLLRVLSQLGKLARFGYEISFALRLTGRAASHTASLRRTIAAVRRFVPLLPRFLLMFVVVIYFYAMIGMAAFAGRLDPSDETVALTGYAQAGYAWCRRGDRADDWNACDDDGHGPGFVASYAMGVNFNDLISAYLTLYALLNLNNWHVLHEAGIASLGPKDHTWRWAARRAGVTLYFVSFVLICFILLMNMATSTFLAHFAASMAHADKVEKQVREDSERKAQESALRALGGVTEGNVATATAATAGPTLTEARCFNRSCEHVPSCLRRWALGRGSSPPLRSCAGCGQVYCERCCPLCIDARAYEALNLAEGAAGYAPLPLCAQCARSVEREWEENCAFGEKVAEHALDLLATRRLERANGLLKARSSDPRRTTLPATDHLDEEHGHLLERMVALVQERMQEAHDRGTGLDMNDAIVPDISKVISREMEVFENQMRLVTEGRAKAYDVIRERIRVRIAANAAADALAQPRSEEMPTAGVA